MRLHKEILYRFVVKDWEGVQVPFKEPDDNITTKLASDKSVSSTQHVVHSPSQSHVVKHESGTTEIVPKWSSCK